MVLGGDAEMESTEHWDSLGSRGGAIFMHDVGPRGSTKSYVHVDRPYYNSGPGQSNLDLSCFTLNKKYEIKAKIRLVDQNGFYYPCDPQFPPHMEFSCPMLTFLWLSPEGNEIVMEVKNDLTKTWEPGEFNEFHAVFTATEEFINANEIIWWINGPDAGINIVFDDVSIMLYGGTMMDEDDFDENPMDACAELIKSEMLKVDRLMTGRSWKFQVEAYIWIRMGLQVPRGLMKL